MIVKRTPGVPARAPGVQVVKVPVDLARMLRHGLRLQVKALTVYAELIKGAV